MLAYVINLFFQIFICYLQSYRIPFLKISTFQLIQVKCDWFIESVRLIDDTDWEEIEICMKSSHVINLYVKPLYFVLILSDHFF